MTRLLYATLAVASLFAVTACEEPRLVNRPPPGFRKDVFPQEAASKIDVLWVIDNSGSMIEEQAALSASLNRFMELFNRGQVDYRIAITTTDALNDKGAFVGSPAVISPTTPEPTRAFEKSVKVGTSGKGFEQGLESARLALEGAKKRADDVLAKRDACRATCIGGNVKCIEDCDAKNVPEFLRPDAHLYVVFVSDEDDSSFGEVRYFYRYLEQAMGVGNEGAVNASAIVGDVPSPACQTAAPGKRYNELANLTGGALGSICDAKFDTNLERLALNAVGLKRKFSLAKMPDPATLEVVVKYRCDTPDRQRSRCQRLTSECDGQPADTFGLTCYPPQGEVNGWTFEPGSASIFFNGDSVPGLRSQVEVSYQDEAATGLK